MNKKLAKILRGWADHLDPQERIVFQPGTSYEVTIHGGGGGGSGRPGNPGGSARIEDSLTAYQQIPRIHSQKTKGASKERDQDYPGENRN